VADKHEIMIFSPTSNYSSSNSVKYCRERLTRSALCATYTNFHKNDVEDTVSFVAIELRYFFFFLLGRSKAE